MTIPERSEFGTLPKLSGAERVSADFANGEFKQMGPYKILQKIAEGGMGAVYMAQQETPIHRKVALKVIKANISSKQIIARFEAERQALAMMDHPNIARIFDAGTTDDGIPYFVMELVKGIPLTEYCDTHRLSIIERLELFIPVCRAVQHAHTKGIIHRDLKPSNVLVARYDSEPVAKVIDFGLAKAINYRSTLTDKTMFTEFGQIVGTLQYMSPEQAELNQLDVDTRTDIYALGAMLYELLTGSTPLNFALQGNNVLLAALAIIRESEPPLPSTRLSKSTETASGVSLQRKIDSAQLCQLLRLDLDWIVMKALEKERDRRYETANDLAEELRRYLAGEESTVHPPSLAYRIRKTVRRNQKTFATIAAIFLLLIAGIIGTGSMWLRAEFESSRATREASIAKFAQIREQKTRREVEIQRDQIADAELISQRSLARSDLFLAHARWDDNRFGDALDLLNGIPAEHRNIEWFLARDKFQGRAVTCSGHTDEVLCTEFSPDGNRIVSGGADHSIRIFDALSGKELRVIAGHQNSVTAIRFVDDDQFITGSKDGSIRFWSLEQAESTGMLFETKDPIIDIAISHDRSVVSAIVGTKKVVVWSLPDKEILREIKVDGAIRLVAAPTGEVLYAISMGILQKIDIKSEKVTPITIPLREEFTIRSLDLSPTGDRIAICGAAPLDKDVIFHGINLADSLPTIFAMDLKDFDEIEAELDYENLSLLTKRYVSQFDAITAIRFTQDGRGIIAGSDEGTVEYWDFNADTSRRVIAGHTNKINDLAISSDGVSIASCSSDKTLKIGRLSRTNAGTQYSSLVFGMARSSHDGRKLAFDGIEGVLTVVDFDSNSRTEQDFDAHHLSFSSQGNLLAAWKNQTVKIIDLTATGRAGELVARSSVTAVDFSQDGKFVLIGEARDRITLLSWPNRERIQSETNGGGRVSHLACSRDAQRFAAAGEDGIIRVFEKQSGSEPLQLKGHTGSISCLCFSSDGRYIASGDDDHSIYLWDSETGKQISRLDGHLGPITSVVFTSHGDRIISTALDKTIRVWERSTGMELLSTPTRYRPMDLKINETGDQLIWTEFGDPVIDFPLLNWLSGTSSSQDEMIVKWNFREAVDVEGSEATSTTQRAMRQDNAWEDIRWHLQENLKLGGVWEQEVMEFFSDFDQPSNDLKSAPYAIVVHQAHVIEAIFGSSARAQLVRQSQKLVPNFIIDGVVSVKDTRAGFVVDFQEAVKEASRNEMSAMPAVVVRAMEAVGMEMSPPTETAADRIKSTRDESPGDSESLKE